MWLRSFSSILSNYDSMYTFKFRLPYFFYIRVNHLIDSNPDSSLSPILVALLDCKERQTIHFNSKSYRSH